MYARFSRHLDTTYWGRLVKFALLWVALPRFTMDIANEDRYRHNKSVKTMLKYKYIFVGGGGTGVAMTGLMVF